MVVVLILALAWLVLFPWASWTIGKPKGRSTQGLLLGLFFGLIGMVVVWALPPTTTAIANDNHQRSRAQSRNSTSAQAATGDESEEQRIRRFYRDGVIDEAAYVDRMKRLRESS